MKHQSLITTAKKADSNVINTTGESKTDKSQFRPDIASVRDKAIALQQSGAGRDGVYDVNNEKQKMTDQELKAIAYARRAERDITEIYAIRDNLKTIIENNKETDKENLRDKIEQEELKNTFKKIAENTKKDTKIDKTSNTNV